MQGKHTLNAACLSCGTIFHPRPLAVREGKGKYCSFACFLKALGTAPERFWRQVDTSGECWLWTGSLHGAGYGQFRNKDSPSGHAHRYSYALAYGPIPAGLLVCHHCDTPACVRPDHLFLGTQQDNMHDMAVKGRHPSRTKSGYLPRGSAHPKAKLNEADVAAILACVATGRFTHRHLGRLFGIKHSTVGNIARGKIWSHVPRAE